MKTRQVVMTYASCDALAFCEGIPHTILCILRQQEPLIYIFVVPVLLMQNTGPVWQHVDQVLASPSCGAHLTSMLGHSSELCGHQILAQPYMASQIAIHYGLVLCIILHGDQDMLVYKQTDVPPKGLV